jgi:hypothetical protein
MSCTTHYPIRHDWLPETILLHYFPNHKGSVIYNSGQPGQARETAQAQGLERAIHMVERRERIVPVTLPPFLIHSELESGGQCPGVGGGRARRAGNDVVACANRGPDDPIRGVWFDRYLIPQMSFGCSTRTPTRRSNMTRKSG